MKRNTRNQRGSALVVVAILITGLATATLFMLMTVGSAKREKQASQRELEATYAAEAAMNMALLDLATGGTGELGLQNAAEFGGTTFSVAVADLGGGVSELTAQAQLGPATSTVEAVVQEATVSIWAYGAFGDEYVTMDSNAMVDSYDASLGSYASQEVNGSGNSTYASANGNVGSNDFITIRQNSTIHGAATPGPNSSTTVIGNASVSGSTAPSTTTVEMPPLTPPALTFTGPLSVPGGDTVVLPAGDHAYDSLLVGTGATLQVTGPATLYVGSAELLSA